MKFFKKLGGTLLASVLTLSLVFCFACGGEEVNTYSVKYMVEGAQYGSTVIANEGETIPEPEAPSFSESNYTFIGWYTNSDFIGHADSQWNFATDTISQDLTLYAGYKVEATVSFVIGENTNEKTVSNLASITAPDASKDGFLFKGWATTAEATVAQITDSEITYNSVQALLTNGAVTLYPVYTEVKYSLKVSVWTKGGDWVTADELSGIKALVEDSLEDCGYVLDEIAFNYVETTTDDNKVADLSAIVNDAADFDIIIGCGNNVNSSGNVTGVLAKASVSTDIIAASRMAALLSQNEIAVAVYCAIVDAEYTEAAITFNLGESQQTLTVNNIYGNVTAPQVNLGQGETLLGWATSAEATEATIISSVIAYADVESLLNANGELTLYPVIQTSALYSAKISVWTKGGGWVTADELESIKTGILAALQTAGYSVDEVTLIYVETTTSGDKVADLSAVVNTAGDFDIIIGCGNNVDSSGNVTGVLAKASVSTDIIAAGRMAALLSQNEIAQVIYTYLTGATYVAPEA